MATSSVRPPTTTQCDTTLPPAVLILSQYIEIDPEIVADLLRPKQDALASHSLSARERDVLALIAEGLTNSGIAQRLYLSERTSRSTCAASSPSCASRRSAG